MTLNKLHTFFNTTHKKYIETITEIAKDGGRIFIKNMNEEFNFDKFAHEELKQHSPDYVVDTVVPIIAKNKLYLVEFKNMALGSISKADIEKKLSDSLKIIKIDCGLNNTDTCDLDNKLECILFYSSIKKENPRRRSKNYDLRDISMCGKKLNVKPDTEFNNWYMAL